jgi:hypothetical protein
MSDIVRTPTSQDDERQDRLVKYWILLEAFNRDFAANRPNSSNNTNNRNEITLNEIHDLYPAIHDIEIFRKAARGMAMKDGPLIEFVGNMDEDTIQ